MLNKRVYTVSCLSICHKFAYIYFMCRLKLPFIFSVFITAKSIVFGKQHTHKHTHTSTYNSTDTYMHTLTVYVTCDIFRIIWPACMCLSPLSIWDSLIFPFYACTYKCSSFYSDHSIADRGLFCSSNNLIEILDNPTSFCKLSGKSRLSTSTITFNNFKRLYCTCMVYVHTSDN